jgi:hypothetical protein
MSKFEMLRQLRQRHEDIRENVEKTMNDLNNRIDSCESDPGNWYLEKLVNVLRVQQKLLDNRMTSSIGSASENTEVVHKELDRVEQLIKEIRLKSSLQ